MPTRGQERLDQLRQALEIYPDDPGLQFSFARECMRHDLYEEAITALQKAIQLRPDYSAAYRELGRCLVALERLEEARHIFEEGMNIARRLGDLQTLKEMEVFLRRIQTRSQPSEDRVGR